MRRSRGPDFYAIIEVREVSAGEKRKRERKSVALESEEDFHGERTRYPSREDATIREVASVFFRGKKSGHVVAYMCACVRV